MRYRQNKQYGRGDMKLSHTQAAFLMVAVTLMWSIAGVVTRQLENARSFEVTFWRSFFTAVSLLVILPLWQGRGVFRAIHWRSRAFWLSGVCWSVMFTAFMVALTMASVANVLITLAAGPLLTALFARIAIGNKLPLRTAAAIVVAGAGIAYMFGSQVSLGGGQAAGMLVALCVPIAGAVQWTIVQRSQAHGEKLDLVPSVLVGAMISSLVTLPLSFPFVATGQDVAWLALLGLVQLAIPCVLSVVAARVLKAPEVSLLALLEVIFGIALAWLGAGEQPGSTVLAGGALVIGALLANELLGWRQRNG
jgi:drug/metabolite transporter (DMT)-like permease